MSNLESLVAMFEKSNQYTPPRGWTTVFQKPHGVRGGYIAYHLNHATGASILEHHDTQFNNGNPSKDKLNPDWGHTTKFQMINGRGEGLPSPHFHMDTKPYGHVVIRHKLMRDLDDDESDRMGSFTTHGKSSGQSVYDLSKYMESKMPNSWSNVFHKPHGVRGGHIALYMNHNTGASILEHHDTKGYYGHPTDVDIADGVNDWGHGTQFYMFHGTGQHDPILHFHESTKPNAHVDTRHQLMRDFDDGEPHRTPDFIGKTIGTPVRQIGFLRRKVSDFYPQGIIIE